MTFNFRRVVLAGCSSLLFASLAAPVKAESVTAYTNAQGTVTYYPEFNLGPSVFSASEVYAYYFRTTAQNREIGRGFIEFALPSFSGSITSATLYFQTCCQSSSVVPAVTYSLSSYAADGVVNAADFAQATTFTSNFSASQSVQDEAFSFDVTSLVMASVGGNLGFRLNLDNDIGISDYNSFGENFATYGPLTPRIVIDYVAAPVPEPETYAMMLAGLGLLGLMTRRRKQKAVA